MNDDLRGKTYIAYARCAAADGSAPKLREQIRLIRRFGESLGMRCADEVRLAGVGGWLPALRPDLCALLARRRQRRDYAVLLVADHARLTRTGVEGLAEIEAAFASAGVQIVHLTERIAAARAGPADADALVGRSNGGSRG